MDAGTEPRPGPARYALLASAVAGRPLDVRLLETGLSWTDGETVHVAGATDAERRDAVIVQAALLAAGAFDAPGLARLAARPDRRARYVALETARAAVVLGEVLPLGLAGRMRALCAGAAPATAVESARRATTTAQPPAPSWCGTIRPLAARRARATPRTEGTGSTDRTGLPPGGGHAAAARLLRRLLGGERPLPGGGEPGGQGRVDADGAGAPGDAGRPARVSGGEIVFDAPARRGATHPEWHWLEQRYRRDWCTVRITDPDPGDHASPAAPATDPRLRRELARISPTPMRHRRQADGDALDLSALVDAVVDRRSGRTADERVYEARRRTGHDLGVLVLLDATGSTGEAVGDRTVFEEQRLVAHALVATFEELGDRVAAYGFSSRGRRDVRFLRVKEFDERYGGAAQHRMARLRPSGYTRLGAAVRHGAHLVRSGAGTSRSLLVVVGDGLPYDHGYEGAYAAQDSRRAITEAMQGGLGCACVSVAASTPAATIDEVWGAACHRTLRHAGELPEHVHALIGEAVRSAARTARDIGRPGPAGHEARAKRVTGPSSSSITRPSTTRRSR